MSYVLGQIDPTPPPVRPPNWPVIIGWVGLVGASLAILNGTLSLHGMRANRRRRSTRKNRRRLSRHMRRNSGLEQFDFSGDPSGRKFIIRVAARDMFDAVGKLKEELKNLDYDTAAQMEGWPTKLSAYQLLRTSGRGRMAANPRYRMWTGPMYPRQVADGFSLDFDAALTTRNTGRRSSRSATLGWTDPLGFPGYAHQADNARSLGVRPLTKAEYKAEVIRLRGRRHWDTGVVDQLARRHREHTGKKLGENAGRRSSHARPKSPKFSEMAIWESVARVRESGRPSEVAGVLPPGVATKFKHLAPGLYKYGYGPKKGEVIVQFKNASLKGALTSTRIGAKAVGEFHWVVDNFDPKFPVVIRGIDDHGATYWRVEEYAKQHARVPVLVKRKAASR
jgi:hypothetical protein